MTPSHPTTASRWLQPLALGIVVAVLWSTAIGVSLYWNLTNAKRQSMEQAYAEAGAIRDKDMAFRRWALKHQGVYIAVTDKEQPSSTMAHVPGRDLLTTDGRQLTLRAPATMVREMMDDYADTFGTRGRIVGLRYLSPTNAPDDWEKTQLKSFELGVSNEVWEVADMNGQPHLRYLKAWYMEEGCVKCHAILGYQVGDMRGATGVNLPLTPYFARLTELQMNLALTHGVIWLLGLLGIGYAAHLGEAGQIERRRNEASLRLHASIFDHSSEAILVTDRNNRIVSVNETLSRITGYPAEDLIGADPKLFSSGATDQSVYQEMWEQINRVGHWQGELWDRRKDGSVFPKWVSISSICDEQGAVSYYTASFLDITERKAAEERIRHLAHYDSLTGLLNRFSLESRLAQALAFAQRNKTLLAVMFIDLDRFKRINDSLGHSVGDQLLIEVAHRLQSQLRDSDIVARLGGDEFVICLTAIDVPTDAMSVADKLLQALAAPYLIADKQLHSTASIGVALYPDDAETLEELMKNADMAMYHGKENGRANIQFFTNGMNTAANLRLAIENDLRMALERDELLLYYQPKINSQNNRITGFEALLRWHHRERGIVSPLEFIPIAEETGLIVPIGQWVLDQACQQLARWHQAGHRNIHVAVNLSAQQLRSDTLPDLVRSVLERNQLAPTSLQLEITESVAMDKPEHAINQLRSLREIGVSLAIDDFGTGYSSLSYLKLLPVQYLKIDRSFVSDIEHDPNDAAIVSAIVALAEQLGLSVIAEGVETEIQSNFLHERQCAELQGYLFGKPAPADTWNDRLLSQSTMDSNS